MVEVIDRRDDYGRWLINDEDYRQSEIGRIEAGISRDEPRRLQRGGHLRGGVSVVIATYRGRDRIIGTIDSLISQTLDPQLFEIIIVCNGPDDGTASLARRIAEEARSAVRILYTQTASAGNARNIGIAAARREYVTFLDDDDRIEQNYLASMLHLARLDRIVTGPIVDLLPDGRRDDGTVLASRLREVSCRTAATPVEEIPWVLGFNACKLVPTRTAREAEYPSNLKSGEDVAYMASLLGKGLSVVGAAESGDNAYIRTIRSESVSRQHLSFDFAVRDRVRVIESLPHSSDYRANSALGTLARAQAGFISRYLDDHPSELDLVVREVEEAGVSDFPWSVVNRGRATDLAFLYCFAPYLDSSGVVGAKALAERDRIVDVISADMSNVRPRDEAVDILASRWIDRRHITSTKASFSGWNEISTFAQQALRQANVWNAEKGGYENLYTRALWVGSHVAGALFKQEHWNVKWTAEFSDPLGRGVDAERRPGKLIENDTTIRLRRALALQGVVCPPGATLFEFMELVTYVMADEIIFTNENQRDYMLSLVDDDVARLAHRKSVVRRHPSPIPAAYSVRSTKYAVPESTVNIGYFGTFYGNRTLDEVLTGLRNLDDVVRRSVRIHIFCNKPSDFRKEVQRYGLTSNVMVNSYLSYMEFLNASTLFDALIVKDVDSSASFDSNPFLPSKYSDYRGSGVPVWGIVEDGSPLSKLELTYESLVGDSVGAKYILERIVRRSDQ